MKKVIEGYIDKNSLNDALHYSPATGYEISDKQKPLEILRIRRIYKKPLNNYWFKSSKKVKEWVKVKITLEAEIKKQENLEKKCSCGHDLKYHVEYMGKGKNKKGSRFVCTKDGCSLWNLCDL